MCTKKQFIYGVYKGPFRTLRLPSYTQHTSTLTNQELIGLRFVISVNRLGVATQVINHLPSKSLGSELMIAGDWRGIGHSLARCGSSQSQVWSQTD